MKYERRKKKFVEFKEILVQIAIFSCLISTAYGNKKYVNNLDKLSKKLGLTTGELKRKTEENLKITGILIFGVFFLILYI